MGERYAGRFRADDDVDSYDALYATDSKDAALWALQRPVVQRLVRQAVADRTGTRLLDFASGTGRILAAVAELADEVDALDLSATMLDRARERQTKARLVVGTLDGDATPPEARRDYDVITCFRFFLNVDDDLRRSILAEFRQRLHARRGWLIVNNHGHARSLRTLAVAANRDPDAMHSTLSDRHFRQLLSEAGFRVVADYGFGLTPDVVHRSKLRRASLALDRWGARTPWTRHWAVDRVYMAQWAPTP